MELYVLPLGDCCCNYEVIAPGVQDGRRIHIPVPGYLIRLDDRLMLVDTGMHRAHVRDPELTQRGQPFAELLTPAMRPEDSLLFRLAQLDIAPQDIDYVVNTHLHFDHAGNNDLLTKATFFVQREHYAAARTNSAVFPHQYWNLPHLRYELLDGESTLFPGLEILLTPGHAPAHQSVLLRLPETGPVIICGDAVYCQENFDHDTWNSQADPETARKSAFKLRETAEREGALLFYGHDRNQARDIRYAPQSYRQAEGRQDAPDQLHDQQRIHRGRQGNGLGRCSGHRRLGSADLLDQVGGPPAGMGPRGGDRRARRHTDAGLINCHVHLCNDGSPDPFG